MKNKTKILYVIDHLAYGGGQMSLKTIVENMPNDIECIICPLRNKPNELDINKPYIRLNSRKYNPFPFIQIAKICRNYKIDILHPQLDKSIIICLIASFFCQSKVVIHERGGIALLKGFASILYKITFRFLQNRASAIIANSNSISLELQKKANITPSSIKVIYNPIDFNQFNSDNFSNKQSRVNFNINDNTIVIGYVGRLHYNKGVDILIKSLSIILEKNQNCLLVLAGDGPERMNLEKLCEKLRMLSNVKFLGMCNNIPEIISTFDIAIVPSRHESFGRVAVEIMRMKVPLICSGIEGLAEIVENRITGIIFNINDPHSLAHSIEELIQDEKLKSKLIENAYDFSQRFNAAEHIKQILSVYLEILK